ncbi:sugar ABC transporter substrate-binding protein [Sphaerisporangium siamense]|uniref:Ribose transport system substrate-binding protein n=1 Tax=Sphaerisporangium siamense TaxID=795645 RepID=A0A7W7G9Q4_9ACTN|nr:substrate-binding domain-containing protein [Sphaerisporangium siamense]MBB4701617.1 ribose transport system substrate-binding protein [Sphaerisporangium siamense]
MSGVILALAAQALATAALPAMAGPMVAWSFAVAVPVAGALGFFAARRLYGSQDQAFIVVSAFTHTRWLGDVLDDLSRTLDRHGIDLVVKLPSYDHSGQNQRLHLASLRKRKRSYMGGFIIAAHPERTARDLREFCEALGRPVVFMDVRPFLDVEHYPSGTAFVGCDSAEIGEKAAHWVAEELTGRQVANPAVLVISEDTLALRHETFADRLKGQMPSARVDINLRGYVQRPRTREIVGHHLRRLEQGQSLDAIFCTNDEMALGAVDAVQEYVAGGRRLDGLVIIGVDGIGEAVALIDADTTPFRATISQDTRRIVEVAVDALLRMRSGHRVTTETFVPTAVYPKE